MNEQKSKVININKDDIDSVYIDLNRNIEVVLKNCEKVTIQRSEQSKKIYKYLQEEDDN